LSRAAAAFCVRGRARGGMMMPLQSTVLTHEHHALKWLIISMLLPSASSDR